VASKLYNSSALWGAVAISAGATALVVGAAVFFVMQAQRNVLEVRVEVLEQQLEAAQQQAPSEVPSDEQRGTTGTGLPTTQAQDGTKTTTVPVNGGTSISYPGTYDIYQNVEPDRRGSFAAFDFLLNIQTLVAVSPSLQSVEFFNADSVAAYNFKCSELPDYCRGSYPTPESMFQEFRSIESGTIGADGELVQFHGTNWLVKSDSPPDGRNLLRRYAGFLGDTRVEVTFWMEDAGDWEATDALFDTVSIGPMTG
jgi:type II secretory pathway pseudopilin PulG